MTEEQIVLARRAVACKGWRWMEGMLAVRVEDGRKYRVNTVSLTSTAYVPDLTDPATLGCLLALVREAWRCPVITSPDYDYDDDEAVQGETVTGWRAVETVRWMTVGEGAIEIEALVAALESAP